MAYTCNGLVFEFSCWCSHCTKARKNTNIGVKEKGIFVVEVGELERFAKSVGNHRPKWVNEVLTKYLINDPELAKARKFISEVTK